MIHVMPSASNPNTMLITRVWRLCTHEREDALSATSGTRDTERVDKLHHDRSQPFLAEARSRCSRNRLFCRSKGQVLLELFSPPRASTLSPHKLPCNTFVRKIIVTPKTARVYTLCDEDTTIAPRWGAMTRRSHPCTTPRTTPHVRETIGYFLKMASKHARDCQNQRHSNAGQGRKTLFPLLLT